MTTGPSSQPSTGLIRHLDDLLTCSICISTFVDPFVTPCGHSFCYSCINQHLAAGEREAGTGSIGAVEAVEDMEAVEAAQAVADEIIIMIFKIRIMLH